MITTWSVKWKNISPFRENIRTCSVGNGICPCPPTQGEELQKRGDVLLAGGGGGASVPCCAPRSLLSGGDDRRVATKLGQSPRSPGPRTKRMASTAEKLTVVTRELPAHNQYKKKIQNWKSSFVLCSLNKTRNCVCSMLFQKILNYSRNHSHSYKSKLKTLVDLDYNDST